MQGHYNINTNPANVGLSLERFIALGVEVSITELDIQAGSDYRLSEQLANAQGYLYAQLMDLFRAHADHIKRVTFWGMDDGTSWRASTNPLLFDKDLQAKPAYDGVIDPAAFLAAHQPETKTANRSIAPFGTPVIDGTVDQVWRNAPERRRLKRYDRHRIALQAGQDNAKFADSGSIAAYAQEAIRALHEAGVLSSRGNGAFDPQGTATRAEAAVMLHRILSL